MREVFWVSLKLGLTSFGGPIAHIGYFERVYVRERGWVSSPELAGLLGLCQLLPGPTSSQLNFLLGVRKAGWPGGLAAWVGFTLPSAILMFSFGLLAPGTGGAALDAILHGLMLTAVAIVAQAVWSMGRRLCPDWQRLVIALCAAALVLARASATMQLGAMLLGAAGGWILCRHVPGAALELNVRLNHRTGLTALAAFTVLLLVLQGLAIWSPHGPLALAAVFYRAGALVFGGGHVVLPLLRQALVPTGWISDGAFLSGYGLAQAMPGPLFTVAAYLGAAATSSDRPLWSIIALVSIFLPGLLLAVAGLHLWRRSLALSGAHALLAGVNAAVVGILAAALYNPVCTSSVHGLLDAVIAGAGFLALQRWRTPPVLVVLGCLVASLLAARAFGSATL